MITLSVENQKELRKLTYRITKSDLDARKLTYRMFVNALVGFTFFGVIKNEVCIGTFMLDYRHRIHIAIVPEQRKLWAGKWVFVVLQNLVLSIGTLYSIVRTEDENGILFANRLGFRAIREEGDLIVLQYFGRGG